MDIEWMGTLEIISYYGIFFNNISSIRKYFKIFSCSWIRGIIFDNDKPPKILLLDKYLGINMIK